jgi:RNA polymerase primary sigma factor
VERIITKSFARLMGRGIHRGFITHEELNKSLGKRNLSEENLAQAFIHILDEKIVLVEKKSDYKILRKKDASSKEDGKTLEKSDDPIRMYLREMGGVELLSREGEIAIAKRIEAGKDVMLNALSQSPITAQQFFDWDIKLQNDEILVREIIDIPQNKKNKMKIKAVMKIIMSKMMNLTQLWLLWKQKLNRKYYKQYTISQKNIIN